MKERGTAIGMILGGATMGNVVSPFAAGFLAGIGDWRLFFLVYMALALVSAVLVWRFLKADTPKKVDEGIDYAGMLVLSLALFALLYALDVGLDWGWFSRAVLTLFAVSVALFATFPLVETRVRDPMVPLPLMRNPHFVMALLTNGLAIPALFLLFLYMPQYLHKVFDWSTLWASMGVLPLFVALAIVSMTVGRFYNSLGPRWLLTAGHVLVVLGAAWVVVLSPNWGYAGLVPPMLLIGIGSGMIIGPAGTAAVNAADKAHTGLAGGLSFMFHLGLGAVGVAGATALMMGTSLASLGAQLQALGIAMPEASQIALNAGVLHDKAGMHVLNHYTPDVAAKIVDAARNAFVSGLHRAYWMALTLAIMGFVVCIYIDEEKLVVAENARS